MADILEDEIANDPLVRGYSGMSDQQLTDDLHTQYRTRNRDVMTSTQIMAEVGDAAYDALTNTNKTKLLSLLAIDGLDPFGFAANVVKEIFGDGSATVLALASARVESISRAEELGIAGITIGHVTEARS